MRTERFSLAVSVYTGTKVAWPAVDPGEQAFAV